MSARTRITLGSGGRGQWEGKWTDIGREGVDLESRSVETRKEDSKDGQGGQRESRQEDANKWQDNERGCKRRVVGSKRDLMRARVRKDRGSSSQGDSLGNRAASN